MTTFFKPSAPPGDPSTFYVPGGISRLGFFHPSNENPHGVVGPGGTMLEHVASGLRVQPYTTGLPTEPAPTPTTAKATFTLSSLFFETGYAAVFQSPDAAQDAAILQGNNGLLGVITAPEGVEFTSLIGFSDLNGAVNPTILGRNSVGYDSVVDPLRPLWTDPAGLRTPIALLTDGGGAASLLEKIESVDLTAAGPTVLYTADEQVTISEVHFRARAGAAPLTDATVSASCPAGVVFSATALVALDDGYAYVLKVASLSGMLEDTDALTLAHDTPATGTLLVDIYVYGAKESDVGGGGGGGGAADHIVTDAGAATTPRAVEIGHETSATPLQGFGVDQDFTLSRAPNTRALAGRITVDWRNAFLTEGRMTFAPMNDSAGSSVPVLQLTGWDSGGDPTGEARVKQDCTLIFEEDTFGIAPVAGEATLRSFGGELLTSGYRSGGWPSRFVNTPGLRTSEVFAPGMAEASLMTIFTNPNYFRVDDDALEIEFVGRSSAASGNDRFRLYYGGALLLTFTRTAAAAGTWQFRFVGKLIRTGAGAARLIYRGGFEQEGVAAAVSILPGLYDFATNFALANSVEWRGWNDTNAPVLSGLFLSAKKLTQ